MEKILMVSKCVRTTGKKVAEFEWPEFKKGISTESVMDMLDGEVIVDEDGFMYFINNF